MGKPMHNRSNTGTHKTAAEVHGAWLIIEQSTYMSYLLIFLIKYPGVNA
jgi:hypothetical protein